MRRKDREITDLAEIEKIIQKARILHLGLVDGDMPYVVPLHYGYVLEDGKLTFYMHGAKEGRKLDLIRANPKTFVEIDTDEVPISGGDIACKYGASFASVMGSGRASIVEDAAEKIRGLNALMKTQTGREFAINEQMAASVAVIRVDVDEFTAKRKPMQTPATAQVAEPRKELADMDNRELFSVAAGDRGPIAQEYLRGIVRDYRAKHGKDADLRTMVQTMLSEED